MKLTKKEIKILSTCVWYHGTTLNGWKNICEKGILSNYNQGIELDFGFGFYLSPSLSATENFVIAQEKYNTDSDKDSHIPVIIVFNFAPIDWISEGMTYRYFSKYDDVFAEYVFKCRYSPYKFVPEYQMTFGVMTDTKPTVLLQKYRMGKISKQDVINEFKKGTSRKQLCLHSQLLCDKIKPSKAYILNGKEMNVNDYKKR